VLPLLRPLLLAVLGGFVAAAPSVPRTAQEKPGGEDRDQRCEDVAPESAQQAAVAAGAVEPERGMASDDAGDAPASVAAPALFSRIHARPAPVACPVPSGPRDADVRAGLLSLPPPLLR